VALWDDSGGYKVLPVCSSPQEDPCIDEAAPASDEIRVRTTHFSLYALGECACISVDTVTMGNSATALGTREECVSIMSWHLEDGTSSGGNTSNALNDISASFPGTNGLAGKAVIISGGTGNDQVRLITGNTATQLTITPNWTIIPDSSSEYDIVETTQIDATIDAVPERVGNDGGVNGFQFVLGYDDSIVQTVGLNVSMMLTSASGSSAFDWSDQAPYSGDKIVVAAVEWSSSPSATEHGQGVLARVTMALIGAGTTALGLAEVTVTDAAPSDYLVPNVNDGVVAVGVPCP
jgi:hypothetical protein